MINKKQMGFTLIELVVVIIILGILAATAAPKFIDFRSDANEATIKSLGSSILSAARLQHNRAILSSANGGLGNGFVFDGIYFDKGYPIGVSHADNDSIPEILEALNINLSDFTYNTIFNGTGSSGQLTRDVYITTRNVIADGATAAQIIATNCYVSYKSFVTVALPPEVATETSGC